MAVSVKTTQFALRTTNGTQDITVAGEGTCKGVLFIVSGADTDEVATDHARFCFGVIDTAGDVRALAGRSRHNSGTVLSQSVLSDTDCIQMIDETVDGSFDGRFQFSSYITDGVRITTTAPPARALLVTAILFFGSDVTTIADHFTGGAASNGGTVTKNIGQKSDLCFWFRQGNNTAFDTINASNLLNFSVSTFDGTTIRQYGYRGFNANNAASSDIRQATWNGRIDGNFAGGSAINRAYEVTSMTATNLEITTREGSGHPTDRPFCFLSVNFNDVVEARVEEVVWPGSGDLVKTGYGFEPQFVLVSAGYNTSSVDETGNWTASLRQNSSYGAADGTRQHSIGVFDEDNVGTTNCKSSAADKTAYVTGSGETLDFSFSSFDADGFTLTGSGYFNPPNRYGFGLCIEADTGTGQDVVQPATTQVEVQTFPGTVTADQTITQPARAEVDVSPFAGTVVVDVDVTQPTTAQVDVSTFPGTVSVGNDIVQPSTAQVNVSPFPGTVTADQTVTQPARAEVAVEPFPGTVATEQDIQQPATAQVEVEPFPGVVDFVGDQNVVQPAVAQVEVQTFPGAVGIAGVGGLVELQGEVDNLVQLIGEIDDTVELTGEVDNLIELEVVMPERDGLDFKLTRARALRVGFTVPITDGRTFDDTETWEWACRKAEDDASAFINKTSGGGGITVTNPSASDFSRRVEVSVVDGDTSSEPPFVDVQKLPHELKFTKSGGSNPAGKGTIDFEPDTARP